jgi:hypothetical protein
LPTTAKIQPWYSNPAGFHTAAAFSCQNEKLFGKPFGGRVISQKEMRYVA